MREGIRLTLMVMYILQPVTKGTAGSTTDCEISRAEQALAHHDYLVAQHGVPHATGVGIISKQGPYHWQYLLLRHCELLH